MVAFHETKLHNFECLKLTASILIKFLKILVHVTTLLVPSPPKMSVHNLTIIK